MKTILLSAGDLSGERHAAALVDALRARLPDTRFVGMGGAAMAAAGVDLWVDQRNLAVGGIVEILGSVSRIVRAWRGMQRCLRESRPDLIVLVDSGGFNLPFARRARAISKAKILYYSAPQVWAWRPGRLQRLVDRTDRIAVVLPFEPGFYAQRGVRVDLVGHPAVDQLDASRARASTTDARTTRISLGFQAEGALLGLFPGSRRNELERHLPVQLEAFARLRENWSHDRPLEGMVVLAASLDLHAAQRLVARGPARAAEAVRIVTAGDERLFEACDVALAKPGTITVELMLRRIPMVVVGRVHPLSAMIARRGLHLEWFAMPNLIANAEIVPELIQEAATRDRIAVALAPLFGGNARQRQIEALDRASRSLGEPGAAIRTAAIAEEMLGTDST